MRRRFEAMQHRLARPGATSRRPRDASARGHAYSPPGAFRGYCQEPAVLGYVRSGGLRDPRPVPFARSAGQPAAEHVSEDGGRSRRCPSSDYMEDTP
jgi:hypothetical protein